MKPKHWQGPRGLVACGEACCKLAAPRAPQKGDIVESRPGGDDVMVAYLREISRHPDGA